MIATSTGMTIAAIGGRGVRLPTGTPDAVLTRVAMEIELVLRLEGLSVFDVDCWVSVVAELGC